MLLALSACQQQPDAATLPQAQPSTQAQADKLIPCSTGNAPLASRCTVELDKRPDGPIVTVRNPDGGMHRLQVTRDGRGLEAADGAQPASVTAIDDTTIEIAIGPDRYRLPASLGRR